MRQLKILKTIQNRESRSLDKYLQEIGKVALIDSDTEVDLAKRIRGGDLAALEKLTKANLRFVVSVAKQYQHFGIGLSDLINEGNVGLMKAAQRFDETRGFKFISYAVWWIRQAIMQSLADNSRVVRLPLNRVSALNKMLKTFSQLEQEFQREPTFEELAHALGKSENEIMDTHYNSHRQLSIDSPFAEGDENNLLEILSDPENKNPDSTLISDSLTIDIRRALGSLTNRESEVMALYFGLDGEIPMSLEELGKRFHLSRERVRQIKEKATRRLRHESRSRTLKTYL